MYFYARIHILSYIFMHLHSISGTSNSELKVIGSGIEKPSPCAVGLQFFVTLNNTSNLNDYLVELTPDQCCLQSPPVLDCDVLEIVGSCAQTIPKGEARTLRLVAPILDPFERKGFCTAYIDSKSDKKVRAMRDLVKINFDTRLCNKDVKMPVDLKKCKNIDEDPMNDCRPVDCEVFYNGKKSFYSQLHKRCVKTPICLNENDDFSNTIYDPSTNQCVHDDPLTDKDVEYVKNLVHSKRRKAKDIVIIKHNHENNTSGLNKKIEGPIEVEQKSLASAAVCLVCKNKSSLSCLSLLVLAQCVLILALVFCIYRYCLCCERKEVIINKFFNKDESVTTPLIGTTNIETETTCQYLSESSNVDKKIQCYKACQKDNAKKSMSDDILSKCLNRRNWDVKLAKSVPLDIASKKMKEKERATEDAKYETHYVSTRKQDAKVNFENERERTRKKRSKSGIKSQTSKMDKPRVIEDTGDSPVPSSELEIKCHSYNNYKFKTESKEMMGSVNVFSEKEIKCHSYNYMDVSDDDVSDRQRANEKGQASAQASFSNDSIDDFLSERGIMFLAGDNMTNTISNDSISKSTSSMSSRTSKNLVKNVLSFLKRNKPGPASDPGAKKLKDSVDLELIHMSRASMYSSSNNESECLKNMNRIKDPRASM